MSLRINEIFFSIQGESTFTGLPCVFVRLSGCNLRCTYCDTTYAYAEGNHMTIQQILKEIKKWTPRWVEVTGGEPLLQDETPYLIRSLLKAGYEVLLETNGSLDIGNIDPKCTRIVDLKCPSSGEADRFFWPNLHRLTPKDQVKFVLQDRRDYAFAKTALEEIGSRIPSEHLLFSAVSTVLPAREVATWILQDRIQVRLHVQLHKILWPQNCRSR